MKEGQKMKAKRVLAFLLSLCMLVTVASLFGVTANAGKQSACRIAGGTTYPTVGEAVLAAGTAKSTIVLLRDVTENVIVPNGADITFDLDGFVWTAKLESLSLEDCNSVIANYGTATVTDSNTGNRTHKFLPDYNGLWKLNETDGTKPVLGGCIIGGSGTVVCDVPYGGGIYNEGTLILTGGNIVGNLCSGIYNSNGSGGGDFSMTGGAVMGNVASGVSSNGTMNMTGGKIMYNVGSEGGGVSTYGSTAVVTVGGNAEIAYNEAPRGGGVSVGDGATFCAEGSLSIHHNTASADENGGKGGGVYVTDNSTFEMGDNVSINHNEAFCTSTGGQGGGIYLCSSVLTATGGSVTDNTATGGDGDGEGGGIYADTDSSCILSGITVTGNTAGSLGGGICFSDEEGCFVEGTKITMADGSLKNIENVKSGDLVRTFDHETGMISSERVCYPFAGEGTSTAVVLHFASGNEVGIVGSHGLLEKNSLKYLSISSCNASSYIGRYFFNADTASWDKLESVRLTVKEYRYYAFYTAHHINCIANGLLSVTDDAIFRLNVFDFDENLKIDAVKKQEDIETYGLTSYDDFKEYTDEKDFYQLNNQYDHIAICKGLVTLKTLLNLAAGTEASEEVMPMRAPALMSASLMSAPLAIHNSMPLGVGINLGSAISGMLIGSDVTVTDNIADGETNNLYLAKGKYILLEEEMENTEVGLTLENGLGQFSLADDHLTAEFLEFFFSDDSAYGPDYNETETYLELVLAKSITYMVDGEAVTLFGAPVSYVEGVGISEKRLKNAIPEVPSGNKFVGWYDEESGGTKVTSISTEVTGDKILYARFASATDVTLTPVALGGYTSEDEGVTKTPIVAFGATFGEYATKDVQKYGFFIYNTNTDLDSAKRAECSVTLTGALAIREGRFFATVSEVGTTDTYYAKAFVVIDGAYYFSSLVSAVGNKDTWLTIDQNAS